VAPEGDKADLAGVQPVPTARSRGRPMLPPIPVNVDDIDAIPATVRPVK